jgi:hypothetical protein
MASIRAVVLCCLSRRSTVLPRVRILHQARHSVCMIQELEPEECQTVSTQLLELYSEHHSISAVLSPDIRE